MCTGRLHGREGVSGAFVGGWGSIQRPSLDRVADHVRYERMQVVVRLGDMRERVKHLPQTTIMIVGSMACISEQHGLHRGKRARVAISDRL